MEDYLYHYGVKGMKWGVRRFDNRQDQIIRKGTPLKRISITTDDKTVGDLKYVSINENDHSKWNTELGKGYLERRGMLTYSKTYVTKKDLKVMSTVNQGKLLTKMMLDKNFKQTFDDDVNRYNDIIKNVDKSDDPTELMSRNISIRTKSAKKFIDEVSRMKYDAMIDSHGTDTSENPIIVFKSSKKLKDIDTDYSDAVKEYVNKKYDIPYDQIKIGLFGEKNKH